MCHKKQKIESFYSFACICVNASPKTEIDVRISYPAFRAFSRIILKFEGAQCIERKQGYRERVKDS